MAIHKNGKNYYYNFQYKGKRFQASTRTSNHDQAFQIYLEKKNEITRHKLRYVDKTFKELEHYKPDAVAFSVITGSHLEYIKIARAIKKKFKIPIIWGGPHATFFPKMIEEDYADAICIGEGEEAALEFANAFDNEGKKMPTKIANFARFQQ